MINGVHHVNFSTADMDRFIGFYRDLLGLELVSDGWLPPGIAAFETIVGLTGTRVRVAQLRAGNLQMEVFQYAEPTGEPGRPARSCDVGIRHVAFDVTGIDVDYERLKAAGVEFFSPPQSLDPHGVRSVYFRDPDQNIVEFQEILPGSKVNRTHVVDARVRAAA